MSREEYQEYLKSDRWHKIREWALIFWGYRCCLCYAKDKIHVHHRTYIRLGHELLTDLIVMCEHCHFAHHDTPVVQALGYL